MTEGTGPRAAIRRGKQRALAWTKERMPGVHRFLTSDSNGAQRVRSLLGFGLIILLGITLLWGGTGQPLGEPPVVVIESGSMMHCGDELGQSRQGDACVSSSFGRLGTIDPGDLVFVRDVDDRSDVQTFAQDGRIRHGLSGDVIVFTPNGNEARTPVIHRAMFYLEVHDSDTFSVDSLGLDRVDRNELATTLRNDRLQYGVTSGTCQLQLPSGIGPADSGFITKGDNNNCWDQSGSHGVSQWPIRADWILGKARGEVPWIGMLKLWTFDLTAGTSNYAAAPTDLKRLMWVSVAVLIGAPYAIEMVAKRMRDEDEGEEDDTDGSPQRDAGPPMK